MEQAVKKDNKTFSNHIRDLFKETLKLLGKILDKLGLKPNTVTVLGLIGNIITAVVIARGHLRIGGILVAVVGILDVADGALARRQNTVTRFGGFFDAVMDRYSDLLILGGLLYYFTSQNNASAVLLTYAAAAGTVLISYVRAKAESVGFTAETGILSRFERYIVLVPALILNFPIVGLWIIAVLGHFTAIQRIWNVWRQGKNKE